MEFQLLPCWETGCPRTFYTSTELSNHHLDAHEIPLKAGLVVPWTPKMRVTPWQPVVRGTLAGVIVSSNGTTTPQDTDAKRG